MCRKGHFLVSCTKDCVLRMAKSQACASESLWHLPSLSLNGPALGLGNQLAAQETHDTRACAPKLYLALRTTPYEKSWDDLQCRCTVAENHGRPLMISTFSAQRFTAAQDIQAPEMSVWASLTHCCCQLSGKRVLRPV